ncbi:YgjV family protein [Shewanella aestuarii]|uniref:YgjV family protein n=2 Tax=Shewanella aestuarii TaxID=1028752 RepID=A0A6G9QPS1_9GAMM|nr:YgjV family protein [Shewanella aestuarii]
MAIGWWANSQKQDCKFIQGNIIAAVLTAIHLGLLGSFLGMANQLVNVIRFRLCQSLNQADKAQTTYWLFSPLILSATFSTIAVAQGLMWAEHWSEWCAVFAAIIMSISLFFFAGSKLRLAMLTSNLFNLMLSIYLLSWSGIIYQVMSIAILSKGLIGEIFIEKSTSDDLNQTIGGTTNIVKS